MDGSGLENRCALVTGATSGIGAATVRTLIEAGTRVIGTGRRTARLSALEAEIGTDRLRTLTLDMRDRAAVAELPSAIEGLPSAFRPDILINNAGLALGLETADAARLEQWDQMIETNVTGLVHLTRAMLPGLKTRPRADIINLSSIAGTYPYPGANVYGATKAFVRQFSLNLRADLVGTRVRVSSVEPGMTETEFSEVRFDGDRDRAAEVYRGASPLTGEDVAAVIRSILALPPHVNVNRIEIMPTDQAFAPLAVVRHDRH